MNTKNINSVISVINLKTSIINLKTESRCVKNSQNLRTKWYLTQKKKKLAFWYLLLFLVFWDLVWNGQGSQDRATFCPKPAQNGSDKAAIWICQDLMGLRPKSSFFSRICPGVEFLIQEESLNQKFNLFIVNLNTSIISWNLY